jgi:hypothetical protein
MFAAVVSAFSRDGPPGKIPVVTHRVLGNLHNNNTREVFHTTQVKLIVSIYNSTK